MQRLALHTSTLPWCLLILAIAGITVAACWLAGLAADPLARDIVEVLLLLAGITFVLAHLLPAIDVARSDVRIYGMRIPGNRVRQVSLVARTPHTLLDERPGARGHAMVFLIDGRRPILFDARFSDEALDRIGGFLARAFGPRFQDLRGAGVLHTDATRANQMWLRRNLLGIVGLAACVPLIALL